MRICGPIAYIVLGCCTVAARAQSIGTMATAGAQVQGVVNVNSGRATIQNNATITAGAEASEVALSRGGVVRVCAGSTVALSQATANSVVARSRGWKPPLMIALQRGAAELQTNAVRADILLTPDLRVELSDGAPLDLRLRLNANGDTCMENLGKTAPILHVTEQFGSAGYLVKPGQRVLFEHGSVRDVVDREGTNCGCPRPGKGGKNEFPEAVSAGLVQPDVPAASAGTTHVQVSTGIDYNGGTRTASGPPAPGSTVPEVTPPQSAPPSGSATQATAASKGDGDGNPFRAIAHFFRRLFGGGD